MKYEGYGATAITCTTVKAGLTKIPPSGRTIFEHIEATPRQSPIVLLNPDPTPVVRRVPAKRKPAASTGQPSRSTISDWQVSEILRLYAGGMSSGEVGKHLGIGRTTVNTYLHRHGAAVRPRGRNSAERPVSLPKTCGWCDEKFERREDERGDLWAKRKTCNRSHAALLARKHRTEGTAA